MNKRSYEESSEIEEQQDSQHSIDERRKQRRLYNMKEETMSLWYEDGDLWVQIFQDAWETPMNQPKRVTDLEGQCLEYLPYKPSSIRIFCPMETCEGLWMKCQGNMNVNGETIGKRYMHRSAVRCDFPAQCVVQMDGTVRWHLCHPEHSKWQLQCNGSDVEGDVRTRFETIYPGLNVLNLEKDKIDHES